MGSAVRARLQAPKRSFVLGEQAICMACVRARKAQRYLASVQDREPGSRTLSVLEAERIKTVSDS